LKGLQVGPEEQFVFEERLKNSDGRHWLRPSEL